MCMSAPGRGTAEDAGDQFEIEVGDLPPSACSPANGDAGPRSPFTRHLSRRARALRLIAALGAVALALFALLAGFAPARDAALGLLPRRDASGGQASLDRQEAAIWRELRARPLHLPALDPGAACPVTPARAFSPEFGVGQGSGDVYALGPGAAQGLLRYAGPTSFGSSRTDWGGARVIWAISLDYGGPVLIRGSQLDGPNPLRFNGGSAEPGHLADLGAAALLPDLTLTPAFGEDGIPWSGAQTDTRLRAPGCYAYQVDGVGFSEVIVFEAVQVP
jgi:hypothetical protein